MQMRRPAQPLRHARALPAPFGPFGLHSAWYPCLVEWDAVEVVGIMWFGGWLRSSGRRKDEAGGARVVIEIGSSSIQR
jgi:hypothetical protein